jgi:hypothetical protein
MWHILGREEVHAGVWWESLSGKGHLEGTGVNGKITLKRIFKNRDGAWTGSNWLRRENCRPLVNAVMKVLFHKVGESS